MGFFRRKRKNVGKGMEESVSFRKEINVLNYVPVDYKYLKSYHDFYINREKLLKKMIDETSPDDLCESMLDHFIDGLIQPQIESAKEQYVYHVQVINQHKGILKGDLVHANGYLAYLFEDLAAIEKKIETYTKLKEERNIH